MGVLRKSHAKVLIRLWFFNLDPRPKVLTESHKFLQKKIVVGYWLCFNSNLIIFTLEVKWKTQTNYSNSGDQSNCTLIKTDQYRFCQALKALLSLKVRQVCSLNSICHLIGYTLEIPLESQELNTIMSLLFMLSLKSVLLFVLLVRNLQFKLSLIC